MNELDLALERLHLCAFETADGVSNCGPMAAFALEELGHPALTSGLMDVYVPRFPALRDGTPLGDEEVPFARGRRDRAPDWVATFEAKLESTPWQEVLVSGLRAIVAAPTPRTLSTDALERVAYAVAALERVVSAPRVRELAFALAWAAASSRDVRSAPPSPPDAAGWLRRAQELGGRVVETGALLGDVCLAAAEHYLANPDARSSNVNAVVVPSALRRLLPHLPPELLDPISSELISQWIAARAAANAILRPVDAEVARCAESEVEIRYRAACSVHEQAIRMAHACLREDAVSPHPSFRMGAADAALRLSPPGYQEWR